MSLEPENKLNPCHCGREDVVFVCPQCGSNYWGTSNLDKYEDEWIGHCHGFNCKFKWPRRDDYKYFKPGEHE